MMDNKGRILIIDDNPKNVQLLANILFEAGYDIEVGMSGSEALDLLALECFDLLMIDIMMPEMDGYEACEKIRTQEKHDLMPIIFISAKNDSQSMVKGFEVGGQDYITKPFDNAELLVRVKTQVELKKSKEKLKNYNTTLEEKITERTKELEKAFSELNSLHNVQDKYLSFIGNEVSVPLQSITKVVEIIRNTAESPKLAEMIKLLDDSVGKLQTVTHMAKQITQVKEKEIAEDKREFSLQGTVELVLFDLDDQLDLQDIALVINIDSGIKIKANHELVKKSFTSVLTNVLKEIDRGTTIDINCEKDGEFVKTTIKANITSWQHVNEGLFPEDVLLCFSYTETIMSLQGGQFIVDHNNDEFSFNWLFVV